MKPVIALFFLCLLPWTAHAAGGHGVTLDKAGIDLQDTESLKRGAEIFVQRCLSCHSAHFMRYNRVGTDLGLSVEEVKARLIAGAAKPGDTMQSGMPAAYANQAFGVTPPDLTLSARLRGADWLYTYLRSFYSDEARPFGVNNVVFKDVGMPNVFWREQGQQQGQFVTVKNGENESKALEGLKLVQPGTLTPEQFDAMIRDLVGFMVYMAEPAQLERKSLGIWVLAFIALFTFVMFLLKREYWRDVK
ncbi:MAG: cytochrome c1 [Halothiobacillaceae bacterium]|nr:cytochrome c1 [Halothiobacillaceae bacterium]